MITDDPLKCKYFLPSRGTRTTTINFFQFVLKGAFGYLAGMVYTTMARLSYTQTLQSLLRGFSPDCTPSIITSVFIALPGECLLPSLVDAITEWEHITGWAHTSLGAICEERLKYRETKGGNEFAEKDFAKSKLYAADHLERFN